jgi:nucleoside phosphorylase
MFENVKFILQQTVQFANEHNGDFERNSIGQRKEHANIIFMTATPQEFNAVKSLFEDAKELPSSENDPGIYYGAHLFISSKSYKVVIPYPNSMGIEAAVNSTTKAISRFSPEILIMCGICVGNKNVSQIGDLIIADKTVNYGHVVEIEKGETGTKRKFMQSALSINTTFKSRLTLFSTDNAFKTAIEDVQLPQELKRKPICHIGLMVTGSTLMRSDTKMKEINDSYHGVKGMDMETHGFYYAAAHTQKDKTPLYVSIKGVSDFGDNTSHKLKTDDRANLALNASVKTTYAFLIDYLIKKK